MSIDISQFHETFLEEASENLVDLEKGLLDMDNPEDVDMDAIFRAAHSIKGGAGTFGFTAIAEFTHEVESVLQKARDGDLEITKDITTTLLKSSDVIGELITAAQNGEPDIEVAGSKECLETLVGYLNGNTEVESSSSSDTDNGAEETSIVAQEGSVTSESNVEEIEKKIVAISFKPMPNMPQTGSDPINIFRELGTLGELSVTAHHENAPKLKDINPEELYIWWDMELVTDVTEEEISEVFLFVEDEAEIEISVIASIGVINPVAKTSEEVASTESSVDTKIEKVNKSVAAAKETAQPVAKTKSAISDKAVAPKESAYIRVAVDKVDSLINLVGELVTTNAMVAQNSNKLNLDQNQQLRSSIEEMGAHTRGLQEGIMAIRMMPIDFAFSRFPRMVRDVSQKLGKKVNLVTEGSQTELDKTVIEKITDPLTHLVRNSIDHGLETTEERIAAGKPEEGIVKLAAYYRGGNVVIEVSDDGRGLNREKILAKAIEKGMVSEEESSAISDEEVWLFIFGSGFSTAAEVTDVSGRGVGMDVVGKNIKALGGSIAIESNAGKGSCITISLPLTLAIVDGMAIKCGVETYIVPLLNIIESIRPTPELIKTLQDDVEIIDIRGDYLPLLRLNKTLNVENGVPVENLNEGIAVIIEIEQSKIALFVDDLLGERQVVIKSIEDNYKQIEGISGATILGDGSIALILDLSGLILLASKNGGYVKPDYIANKVADAKNYVAKGDVAINNDLESNTDQTVIKDNADGDEANLSQNSDASINADINTIN